MRKLTIWVSLAVLMAVGAGPASADKCNGSKIKAIGGKEKSLTGCSGKEATKGTAAVQPACNDKASLKFSAKYNKPTGCVPAAPPEATCENEADACQAALRAALPDGDDVTPSKCEAARLKTAGKLAAAELKCYAKASSKSLPVDTACLTKATGKFTVSFNKKPGCTGDGNASGIQALVESDCVDNMIQVDGGGNVLAILCGGPPPTTTTTTSTTIVTTTSTTTTTIPGPCCGINPSRLSFTTGIGTGNCGTIQSSTGAVTKNLACSGLYTGGGGNTVPLPYNVPDMGQSLTGISSCVSPNLTLTNLTSGQTGSNRNCTSVGCLFGPPLPIPNSVSTPTSVCVINIVATNASGSTNCVTGASTLNLPLTSQLYLTGDLYTAAPGIQVCPVCNRTCTGGTNGGGPCNTNADCPSGGTCGGANVCHSGAGNAGDGNACTPADSVQGTLSSFPTSHDCPPPAALSIGGLPIAFNLTTGTQTKTGQSVSGMSNVFCGYCVDINAGMTGCFEGDPDPACPINATCVSAGNPWNCCTGVGAGTCNQGPKACTAASQCTDGAGTWPDCQQNSAGAFGPAGGGARTITETGSPAGNMTDGAPHASTLASIFCIQPTFNATVDAAGDLPGPGAVTLQGQAQLLP